MSTEEIPTFLLAPVKDGPAVVPSSALDADCGHRVHISNSALDGFLDLVSQGVTPRTVCVTCFHDSIPDPDEKLEVKIAESLVTEFAAYSKMSPDAARATLEGAAVNIRRFREQYRDTLAGGSEH